VRVTTSAEAQELVQERGGRLYVWGKTTRCCHDSITFLETASEPGGRRFRRVEAAGLERQGLELYLEDRLAEPDELVVEVVGRRRRQVRAYWNGCAYVV
jgi:hypothetical protein